MYKFYNLTAMLLLFNISSKAQETLDTEEYKFEMSFPEGFKYSTKEDGRFGVMEGYEAASETYLYAVGDRGTCFKQEIYNYGVKLSGVGENHWQPEESGKNENGFAWWEIYRASQGNKSLYAICGKNAFHEIT